MLIPILIPILTPPAMPTAQPTPTLPFSPDDLNSNDGFLTYVWGPSLWMTLHTISFNYPCRPTQAQKQQYKMFFDSLRNVLPCGKCRDNLVSNLSSTQYTKDVFRNRDTLSRWVYDLHACVNTMLGKDTPVSYEETRQTYENFRARCSLSNELVGGASKRSRRRTTRNRATEAGCTVPVTGVKSKCVLRIVPLCKRSPTMKIDRRCICRKPT